MARHGDEPDITIARVSPHPPRKLKPAHTRHGQTTQHEIRLRVLELNQPLEPIDGDHDIVAERHQLPLHHLAHIGIVVEHEDGVATVARWPSRDTESTFAMADKRNCSTRDRCITYGSTGNANRGCPDATLYRRLSPAWPPTPPGPNSRLLDLEVGPKFRRELPKARLVGPRSGRPASRPRLLLKPFPLRGVFAQEG